MMTKIVHVSAILLLLLISSFLFIITRYSCSNESYHFSFNPNETNWRRNELDVVLDETATANKTLIIVVINKAYVEGDRSMFSLFLDSFFIGEDTFNLVDHLLVVAMDELSYLRCKFLRLHCFKLETEGVDFSKENLYMSEDFIKMMWRRTQFLCDVLKKGYSFIFTDADVLWLRNPFQRLSFDVDLEISTDKFNGDELSDLNPINTGFYMVKSNDRTIGLFDFWYEQKENSTGKKEQDVLNEIINSGSYKKLGLKMRFLDTLHFNGLCARRQDAAVVTTFHANCCRTVGAKIADLTEIIHAWQRYKVNQTTPLLRPAFPSACIQSWLP